MPFRRLDENGHEVPDQEPVHIPAGFRRPESLAEQVQRLVRGAISRQAELAGHESFEEAEDFDVDDESEPTTPYETFFDPVLGKELTPQEFKANEAVYRRRYLEAQRDYFRSLDRAEAVHRPPPKKTAPNKAPEPLEEQRGSKGSSPSPSSESA